MRYIQTLVNPDGTPSVEHGPLECETTRRAFLDGIVYLMQTNHAMRTKAKKNFPRVYRHEIHHFNGIEYVLEDADVRELHAMFADPENPPLPGIRAGLSRQETRLEWASFRAMLRVLAQEAGAPPPDFKALGAMLAKRASGDE